MEGEAWGAREAGLTGRSQVEIRKANGARVRQTWTSTDVLTVAIDFLIPPAPGRRESGRVQNLEGDFAAIITPGLHLAFRNPRRIPMPGYDCKGRWTDRTIPVCGPGPFIVLKALAHFGRNEPKDAFDLYYMLQYYGDDVTDVADDLRPLLDDDDSADPCIGSDYGEPGCPECDPSIGTIDPVAACTAADPYGEDELLDTYASVGIT